MKLLYRLTTVLLPALLWGALFTSCQDDQYNKIDDLFQPRFVLEKPEVKSNSITLVWYKVNDASSYTVELHQDTYYKSLFMSVDTTEPFVFLDDILMEQRSIFVCVRMRQMQSIILNGLIRMLLQRPDRNMRSYWKTYQKQR